MVLVTFASAATRSCVIPRDFSARRRRAKLRLTVSSPSRPDDTKRAHGVNEKDTDRDHFNIQGFRARMAAAREPKNQVQMAKALKIARAQWRRYETAKRLPNAKILWAIAYETGRSLDWLILGMGEKRSTGQISSTPAHPVQSSGAPVVTLSAPEVDMIAEMTKQQEAWKKLTEVWKASKTQPEMALHWSEIIRHIELAHQFIRPIAAVPAPARQRPQTGQG